MRRVAVPLIVVVAGCVVSGCQTIVAAPGATSVKITRNPADVAGCTPVGNIDNVTMLNPDPLPQNKAVGLGGNVILNTGSGGIAYHCQTSAGK
jgi:hypothetical protein